MWSVVTPCKLSLFVKSNLIYTDNIIFGNQSGKKGKKNIKEIGAKEAMELLQFSKVLQKVLCL